MVAGAAQASAEKKAAQKNPPRAATAARKPAPPVVQPLVIPKDAVAQPDGTFRYTDKSGHRWIFSNSPFGVSRMQDMSDPAATADPARQVTSFDKFTEDGDVIRFERATPFGPLKWERKKTELTDEERQAIAAFKPAEKK